MEPMDKKEMRERFERNVAYMQRNVPPDDVYIFAEQTLMAATYFMQRWAEEVNITNEMRRCSVADKWVRNILAYSRLRDSGKDLNLDLNLESVDDDI